MKIGLIGPSVDTLNKINKNYQKILSEIANILSNQKNSIYITADKNSPIETLTRQIKNNEIFLVLPEDDPLGYDWVNSDLGEKVNCGTWRNQPGKTNDETDILLCIGYSAGVLAEISYSKWPKPKPVLIIKELITTELPKELNSRLDLMYISYKNLNQTLKDLTPQTPSASDN